MKYIKFVKVSTYNKDHYSAIRTNSAFHAFVHRVYNIGTNPIPLFVSSRPQIFGMRKYAITEIRIFTVLQIYMLTYLVPMGRLTCLRLLKKVSNRLSSENTIFSQSSTDSCL